MRLGHRRSNTSAAMLKVNQSITFKNSLTNASRKTQAWEMHPMQLSMAPVIIYLLLLCSNQIVYICVLEMPLKAFCHVPRQLESVWEINENIHQYCQKKSSKLLNILLPLHPLNRLYIKLYILFIYISYLHLYSDTVYSWKIYTYKYVNIHATFIFVLG